jgi:phosphatidate cytidylyltransferase
VDAATMTLGTGLLSGSLAKRAATAIVAVPLFVLAVLRAPSWVFQLLVLAVVTAAVWELTRMFAHAGTPAYGRLGIVTTVAVAASFASPWSPLSVAIHPLAVVTASVLVVLSAPVLLGARPTVEPVARTLLGIFYIGWFLGHAIWLQQVVDGPNLILFLVGVTWVGESTAYLVGSTLGRHKLAPLVSPNKTVEGAVAQLVASLAAAAALGWLLLEWSMVHAMLAGGILGVVGQFGDLAESVMKRSAGVKDASGLLPGHGGMLDRIDSLLFNTPTLYYYVVLGGLS